MEEPHRRFLALLEFLHQAVGDAAARGRFLDELRAAISREAVVLFAAQPNGERPGLLTGTGLGVSSIHLGEFLRPSLHHPSASELPLGSVGQIPANHPFFVASKLFGEVLEPAGVLPGPGLFVVCERDARHVLAAILVLPTAAGWKPRAGDRALLERLAPHMVLARRLLNRMRERGREIGALLAAFDQLMLGVVFLDERMRVSFSNRSAAEILGVTAGFASPESLTGDGLDERTRALDQLLRGEQAEVRAGIYPHPLDGRPLQVLATPFRWRDAHGVDEARFTRALLIGDTKQGSGNPHEVLRSVYGLTPGEARLTMLLLSGCSVQEAAGLLEVTVGTARAVLKTIFAKTGTHGQTGLIRHVFMGVGQVRPGAGGKPPL